MSRFESLRRGRRGRRALLAGVLGVAAATAGLAATTAGAVAPIGPSPTPQHTVTLSASPVTGLANGQTVTFSVHTAGGTTLVGNLTARLCAHGFTGYGTSTFGYDGSAGSHCIFQSGIVSGGLTGSDYEKAYPPYAGTETNSGSLTFKVGTGTVTWGNNTGFGPFSVTAGQGHDVDLVIQVNLSGDSVPVTYFVQPLQFGSTAPKAPTAVKAVPRPVTSGSTGKIGVTFASGGNGGSAITKYTATCSSSNGGGVKTGVHTGAAPAVINVAGATLKKTYTCKVTATNVIGTSTASAASAAVTVGAPAQVAKPSVSKAAAGKLRVAFANLNGLQTNGSALSTPKYTAACKSGNGGKAKSATGLKSPIIVSGLSAGKTYTCTVKAHNGRGYGQASVASVPRSA